jgi:Bifunctional DNA primase/polymerase, N-terminal
VSGRPPGSSGGVVQRPLAAGLDYAARGWAVFPLQSIISGRCSCRRDGCPHPAKHPIARHGVHEATTDQRIIRSWWDRWPWANIGIATGARSGLVVIDVDPRSGGDDALAQLESLVGSLPATLSARTGGGGIHLLYAHPGGEIRNTAGRLPGITDPLPGIDLRGDGGYIVATPSRHRSGASYRWLDPDRPVTAPPSWLRPRLHRPIFAGQYRSRTASEAASHYGLSALRAEVTDIRRAPMGERNNRLNRAAFCLGMLVAGGELNEPLAEEELLAAALDVGLSEREATASIRSGLHAGFREPRRRPGA